MFEFEFNPLRRVEAPGHVLLGEVLALVRDLRVCDVDGSFGEASEDTAVLSRLLYGNGGPITEGEYEAVQREADRVFSWFASSGYRPGRGAEPAAVAIAAAVARGAAHEVVGSQSFAAPLPWVSGWDSEGLPWGPG